METAAPETTPEAKDRSSSNDLPDGPIQAGGVAKTTGGSDLGLMQRFEGDQREIWTSPGRLRFSDTVWLVPLSGITAGLFVTDSDFSKHLSQNPTTISHYNTLSNAGVAALVGGAGGMWFLGQVRHNEHWSETGFLAGEAVLNSLVMVEGLKYSLRRERPNQGDGSGPFFQSGGTSFPSEHAAAAWSVAGVIAHEYPGPLTKIMAYGLASLVSVSRVGAHQHFPSDVLIGSVIGNLVAQSIYSRHYNPDLGGGEWRSISQLFRGDGTYSPGNQGSPYVPLDSWVYPAMERLVALGYIRSGFLGMRPWTRMECARLLDEADEGMQYDSSEEGSEPQKIYSALAGEFKDETARLGGAANLGLSLDSVYTRFTGISGTTLQDGLHFGQTVINDYGRPYGEGFNNVTGFTSHGVAGPFSFYVQGEYQHAPSVPALPLQARQVIQTVDFNLPSAPPGTPVPVVNQMDLLVGYVGLQLENWQITFGKQPLWWGEDTSGPMLSSTNAASIPMLQINRVKPLNLPSIFGRLGPIRFDYILGRLSGQHWVNGPNGFTGSWTKTLSDQPFIVGQKISFKPSPNLELGVSYTALFAGSGAPFTTHTLLKAMFSSGNGNPGTASDPGDRRGGFDFAYRIPKMRDWLTFYADAFTDDQVNPWFAWDKTALTSGLYMSRVPGIPKLDFRVEGVYTDLPGGTATVQHGFFYINDRYVSGYTNNGDLIGSWIGRQGQGAQAWTTYWFGPKNKVQLHFRHQKVSREFIPDGGSLTDLGVSTDIWVRSNLALSAWVQHERWLFPVIQSNASRNVTAAVQILFEPRKLFQHSAANAPGDQP
ncbi:MAG: phosphatase PAP2 family protein [Acidobacteriia bacterium]|nr:phosphatase PAP2 family protein [Terriglobia bacterium]